jgi:hypothetical protein
MGNYRPGFMVVAGLIAVAMVCAWLLKVATPDVQARG